MSQDHSQENGAPPTTTTDRQTTPHVIVSPALASLLHLADDNNNNDISDFELELRLRAMKGVFTLSGIPLEDQSTHLEDIHTAFVQGWHEACEVVSRIGGAVAWSRLRLFLLQGAYKQSWLEARHVAVLAILGLEVMRQERGLRAPQLFNSPKWMQNVASLVKDL
eukprot:PhM_4_TR17987/c0_g2_i1/m.63432